MVLTQRELTANGTNAVSMQAPASLTADYTLTLPPDDGTLNQVLTTDGAGVEAPVGDVGGEETRANEWFCNLVWCAMNRS